MTSVKTITEFCFQETTPKELILSPWLKTGELVMIYAPTGVGKSMLAIGLAHAMATGQRYLAWTASKLWSVCYIEAEMSQETCKARLTAQEAGSEISASPERYTIISRDPKDNHLPNIGTHEGQRELLPILLKHDVIVLDNLTSAALPVSGRDDDVRIWYRMKPFLFHLRNLNKTVIIIHHSGKSGDQLGTSLRSNDMDTIIRLGRPVKPLHSYKLGMQIQFEKTRDVPPGMIENLYAEYYCSEGRACWEYQPLKQVLYSQIRDTAKTIKNKTTLSMMFHVPLLEVYEALKEPEPTTFRDEIDPFDDGGENEPF